MSDGLARVKAPEKREPRHQLHPLPRGLVELYGLIAVLVVLIPEWLAEGTLTLGSAATTDHLPMSSRAWKTLPELRLASMNLLELRYLARQCRLFGYASDNRDRLTVRLLTRARRRNSL